MIKIVLASISEAKIKVLELVLAELFPDEDPMSITHHDIPSGVSSTPLKKQETYEGALNRIHISQEKYPDANYLISIEGGFYKQSKDGDYWHTGYVLVKNCTTSEMSEVTVIEFKLPKDLSDLIATGMHCGAALKKLNKEYNSKQTGGVLGHVTGGIIDRMETYYQPLMVAFSLVKN